MAPEPFRRLFYWTGSACGAGVARPFNPARDGFRANWSSALVQCEDGVISGRISLRDRYRLVRVRWANAVKDEGCGLERSAKPYSGEHVSCAINAHRTASYLHAGGLRG